MKRAGQARHRKRQLKRRIYPLKLRKQKIAKKRLILRLTDQLLSFPLQKEIATVPFSIWMLSVFPSHLRTQMRLTICAVWVYLPMMTFSTLGRPVEMVLLRLLLQVLWEISLPALEAFKVQRALASAIQSPRKKACRGCSRWNGIR